MLFIIPFAFVLSVVPLIPCKRFENALLQEKKSNEDGPKAPKPLFRSRFSNPRLMNKGNKRKNKGAPDINYEEWGLPTEIPDELRFDRIDINDPGYGLGTYTIADIADVYDFPIDWLVSSVVRIGVDPPVDIRAKLGDMMNKEQIFAIFEAINTMDPSDARLALCDSSLSQIAKHFEVSVAEVFSLCGKLNLDLPMGVKTYLRKDEYSTLIDALEEKTGIASFRKKPDVPVTFPDLVTEEEKLKYYGLRNKGDAEEKQTNDQFRFHQRPLNE